VGDEKDFQQRVQKIGELVRTLEAVADPAVRSSSKELVQLLMEMHGSGLEKILDIIFAAGDPGVRIIDDLGRDPLVSSLLVLYGLHPDDLPTRVQRGLDQIASKLNKMGAAARLIGSDDGDVRIHASVDSHSCGSTAKTVQATVEEAIYETAPDLRSLAIEGLEKPTVSGFVGIEKLIGKDASAFRGTIPAAHESAVVGSEGMD
jgi:hypothetical protein